MVVVTSSPSTAGEGFVLNSLNLNDGSTFNLLDPLEMPPPKKRQEWIQGADADGASLIRDPLYENRQITARIRIAPQASMDAALALIGSIEDQLEEAEKNEGGIPLVWTPAGSAHSITFYVLSGEFVEGPTVNTRDWFRLKPVVGVRLDCKPFGYGTEVTNAATTTSSSPVQTLTLPSVTGDVPAEGRLSITDAATQSRRHVEWGLQQRHYDAATSLLIDENSLVTSGFAGTATTRTGAYDSDAAGNTVIRATTYTNAVAVCGTGTLGHVGTYRVKARVWLSNTRASVRLSWQDGDGVFRSNNWASSSIASNFAELDLGVISIKEKTLGTQKWSGRIDAITTFAGTGSDTVDIDYIVLIPTEAYGKARAAWAYTAGTLSARDEFTGIGVSALNARVASTGGTWATSGVATDFVGVATGAD